MLYAPHWRAGESVLRAPADIAPGGMLSPLNRRRLANFRRNRRAFVSLILFLVLFLVTLFAEFVTGDRPILAQYKGELLFPIVIDYPESKFGGFLATTNYRDPFIRNEIEANGWMVWPLVRYSFRTGDSYIPVSSPAPPFWMMTLEYVEKQSEATVAWCQRTISTLDLMQEALARRRTAAQRRSPLE